MWEAFNSSVLRGTWRAQEEAVLCFVRADTRVLLIEKLRGLGAGKVNAPGGRVEAGESYVQAAIRETQEEVGVTPSGLSEHADLAFQFTDGLSLHVKVFVAGSFSGLPHDTAEAVPFWCSTGAIPFDRMWEDDRHWLPAVLAGRYVVGAFLFAGDTMLNYRLDG